MRSFIQKQSNPTLEKRGDEDIKVGETNSYMEIEVKNKVGEYNVCYLVPRSENTYFVVACLDHYFDFILEQVENEDEAKLNAEIKAWPLFVTLFKNGIEDRYSEGILIQLEDPDCGEKKWFIATVIGNLDFEKQSDLAFVKVSHAMELVLDKTNQMLTEMIEKHPSYGRETTKTGLWETTETVLKRFVKLSLQTNLKDADEEDVDADEEDVDADEEDVDADEEDIVQTDDDWVEEDAK